MQIFSEPQCNTALVWSAEIYQSPKTCVQNSHQIVQLQLFLPKRINMSCNSSTLSITSVFNYKLCCNKLYKIIIIICMFVYSCVQIEHVNCGIKSLFSFLLANNIRETIFILSGQLIRTAVSFHYMETQRWIKCYFICFHERPSICKKITKYHTVLYILFQEVK